MGIWAAENVFIFNLNVNNEENIQRLVETFEKFKCIVKVYDQPTKSEIEEAALEISNMSFDLFPYIAVIVLDKQNKSEDVIRSSDNQNIMLQSEFLTKILENKDLCDKNILFLLQINRNYSSEDDDLIYKQKIEAEIAKRSHRPVEYPPIYKSKKFYMYATETSQSLPENQADIFIEEFCNVFLKYGHTLGMIKILGQLVENLKIKNYSATPTMEKGKDAVFGYALKDEQLKDFFPNQYRKLVKQKLI